MPKVSSTSQKNTSKKGKPYQEVQGRQVARSALLVPGVPVDQGDHRLQASRLGRSHRSYHGVRVRLGGRVDL